MDTVASGVRGRFATQEVAGSTACDLSVFWPYTTAARGMLEEASAQKELLVSRGSLPAIGTCHPKNGRGVRPACGDGTRKLRRGIRLSDRGQ
jgi:hypothetical protein